MPKERNARCRPLYEGPWSTKDAKGCERAQKVGFPFNQKTFPPRAGFHTANPAAGRAPHPAAARPSPVLRL